MNPLDRISSTVEATVPPYAYQQRSYIDEASVLDLVIVLAPCLYFVTTCRYPRSHDVYTL